MNILVTNDDGVHAPGIRALARAMKELGEVFVVAPDRERSAVGHALTLHHPLRATELSPRVFSVDGTPTDCVNLGIHSLLAATPDLVVSGINRGSNLGDDITYSGTVSAAMEATLMGVPSIAVSLAAIGDGEHYDAAATVALRVASSVIERGLPPDTFLNVNVPDRALEAMLPVKVTTQGKRRYEGVIIDKIDPRGRKYYWIGTAVPSFEDVEGTDFHAISRGHVSLTPLHLDLTNHFSLETLRKWNL